MIKKCTALIVVALMALSATTAFAAGLTPEDRAGMENRVRLDIWGGFETRADIRVTCMEQLPAGTWTEADLAWLDREIARQWQEKRTAEAAWPKETDFDKLDRAFKAIKASGLMALHKAGNTQSDGWDDARQYWHERGGAASGPQGVVFYHGQDLDGVIESRVLYLTYGPFRNAKISAAQIAERVIAALRAQGFSVTPPADESQRIAITGIGWKKRSPE